MFSTPATTMATAPAISASDTGSSVDSARIIDSANRITAARN